MSIEDVAGIGRAYIAAVRARDASDESWAIATWGEGLSDEEHLAVVLEAVDAAVTDEELWMIGDGPVEEGLTPRRTAGIRLRELHSTSDKLRRLWEVMRASHAAEDRDAGWWKE